MNSSLFIMKLETSIVRVPFCTFYTVHFYLALLKMINNTNGKYLVHFFYLNRIFYQKGRATSKDHFSAWIVGFVALEVPHLFLYRSLCKRFDICFRILLFILCLFTITYKYRITPKKTMLFLASMGETGLTNDILF